jgi:hypothetical protein
VDDLQTLVRRRLNHLLNEHEFTAADAVRRANDVGYWIADSTFSQIRKRPTGERWGPPKPYTLLGIAVGLDLPEGEVGDAALRSAGYPIPLRMYLRSSEATEGALCTCQPTHSGVFDELVVELPRPDLTRKKITQLVTAVEQAATQQREQRARVRRSDKPTGT